MPTGQRMLQLFGPASQAAPHAAPPRLRPLHHPAPGSLARWLFDRLGCLPTRPPLGGDANLRHALAPVLLVGPCIATPALWRRLRWRRALDDQAVAGGPHPWQVVPVGARPRPIG